MINGNSKKGFTLIELVLVIITLGLIAVSALPVFLKYSTQVEHVIRDASLSAVRSGILYKKSANGASFSLTELDNLPDSAVCSEKALCFSSVLPLGVSYDSWTKVNSTTYTFNDGSNLFTYKYNSSDGAFALSK